MILEILHKIRKVSIVSLMWLSTFSTMEVARLYTNILTVHSNAIDNKMQMF